MAGIEVREGRLSKSSRLYRHLTERHRAVAMHLGRHPCFTLRKLSGSHDVFLLEDADSGQEHVLKSFAGRGRTTGRLKRYLDDEYECLKHIHKIGVCSRHWAAVKPLCRDRKGLFLVEEKAEGTSLDRHLPREMARCDGRLDEKLDLLAGFFASLHGKTATRKRVNVSSLRKELERHASQSRGAGSLDRGELDEARSLIRKWCDSPVIRQVVRSLTHGDATTTNFLCQDGRLVAIDLERSRYRDPAYDLGMMAGELFGAAMNTTSNPYRADRHIRRLYEKYAGNFQDPQGTFDRLTLRNPLYMANSLLRMSRNDYFSADHRRRLSFYALECLRSGPPG
jgi:aminoglycoside phosphotransferase (APT) family kinase protein